MLTKNTVTKTEVVAFLSFMACLLSRGGVLYTFTHSRGNASILHQIQHHLGASMVKVVVQEALLVGGQSSLNEKWLMDAGKVEIVLFISTKGQRVPYGT